MRERAADIYHIHLVFMFAACPFRLADMIDLPPNGRRRALWRSSHDHAGKMRGLMEAFRPAQGSMC
jgi:outer membrane lipopolysaccharide assembly protein LptE/RlpB